MAITKGELNSLLEQYKKNRGILRRIFGNQKQISCLEYWVKTELRDINDADPVPAASLYDLINIIYDRLRANNPRKLSYRLFSGLAAKAGITQPQIPFLARVLRWLTDLILTEQRSPGNSEDRISTPTLKSLIQSTHKVFEHPVLAEKIERIFQTLKKLGLLNSNRAISVIYQDIHINSLEKCFDVFYVIPVSLSADLSKLFASRYGKASSSAICIQDILEILKKEELSKILKGKKLNALVIEMRDCIDSLIRNHDEKPSSTGDIFSILDLLRKEGLLTIKLATAVTENGRNAFYIKSNLYFLKANSPALLESKAGILIGQGSSAKETYTALRELPRGSSVEVISAAIEASILSATAASPGSFTPSRKSGSAAAESPYGDYDAILYSGIRSGGGGAAAGAQLASVGELRRPSP